MSLDAVVKKLYSTTDAQVWAREWCRIARELKAEGKDLIDEGWMIGWFANAMCVAEDYQLAVEIVRNQRDMAIHDAEQCRAVAREVVAMDRLYDDTSLEWKNLVAMAQKVIS